MKIFLIILSLIGLALTLLPSILVFAHQMDWNIHITLMIIGTILWFITVPFWMKKEDKV
jgi:hypothetical protein